MKGHFLYTISGFILLSSLVLQEDAGCKSTGIKGHVYLESGNRMPSPDRPPSPPHGFKTTLYIYELTNTSQVTRDTESSPFYKTIATRLVSQVESKDDGSFKAKLDPGTYSLFVKKGDLFYSNIYDGQNNIYPVEVKPGAMTEVTYKANYDAVY